MKKYKIQLLPFLFITTLSFVFLTVNSCSKKTGVNKIIDTSFTADTVVTYLALGDSYTIGESVMESERFPNQTTDALRDIKIKIEDPEIIATTGWTTGNLINALNTNPPKNNYTIVTLLIGVNNQYQGRNIEEYKIEFTELVNRSINYADNIKSHVFVLSIPDYSVTPFASAWDTAAIAKEIDSFNEANKTLSTQLGVNYVDVTAISREAATDPALVAGDGLHPSGKQYKRWSDELVLMIKKSLQ